MRLNNQQLKQNFSSSPHGLVENYFIEQQRQSKREPSIFHTLFADCQPQKQKTPTQKTPMKRSRFLKVVPDGTVDMDQLRLQLQRLSNFQSNIRKTLEIDEKYFIILTHDRVSQRCLFQVQGAAVELINRCFETEMGRQIWPPFQDYTVSHPGLNQNQFTQFQQQVNFELQNFQSCLDHMYQQLTENSLFLAEQWSYQQSYQQQQQQQQYQYINEAEFQTIQEILHDCCQKAATGENNALFIDKKHEIRQLIRLVIEKVKAELQQKKQMIVKKEEEEESRMFIELDLQKVN